MANVRRTNNPLEYTQLEGVIVSEQSPVPSVVRRGANNCILIGQFERGPVNTPVFLSNTSEIQSIFGGNFAYSGNRAIRLKTWSSLRIVRVEPTGSAKASVDIDSGGTVVLTITAKYVGRYGNGINVVIAAGTDAGTQKVTVSLDDQVEEFDNLILTGATDEDLAQLFEGSNIVDVTNAHSTTAIPNVSEDLLGGLDGTATSTDYQNAIENANVNVSGKIYFADDQSAGVNSVIANHIKAQRDGICVLGASSLDTNVADAISQSDTLLDQDGRVLFVYNPVKYNINGQVVSESPVYLAASLLSLTPPNISPSAAENRVFTQAAVGVNFNLSRANLILLREAGIMAFEDDEDLGVRIRSSVTGNPNVSIIRRRMSDFLIDSIARFLKNYQSAPNSLLNRAAIKSAIMSFDEGLVADKILPSVADAGTDVLLIETEGTTTPEERAQGIQKVIYKRRIFAEMKFIVLETTIGENVTVENLGG